MPDTDCFFFATDVVDNAAANGVVGDGAEVEATT